MFAARLRAVVDRLTGRHRHAEYVDLGSDGSGALLVRHPLDHSRTLRDELGALASASEDPGSLFASLMLERVAATSPYLAIGLRVGHVYEIVGTPELVNGIQTGAYQLMKHGGSTVSSVVTSGGRIVGHARLREVSRVRVMAPAALWMVLHVAAPTLALRDISRHLATISNEVGKLRQRAEAERLAALDWAAAQLHDLVEEFRGTRVFSDHMGARLAQVEQRVGVLRREQEILLREYESGLRAALEEEGSTAAELLVERLEGRDPLTMHLFLKASALERVVEEFHVLRAAGRSEDELSRRMTRVQESAAARREALEGVLDAEELAITQARGHLDDLGWVQRHVTHRRLLRDAVGVLQPDGNAAPRLGGDTAGKSWRFWLDEEGRVRAHSMPVELPPQT